MQKDLMLPGDSLSPTLILWRGRIRQWSATLVTQTVLSGAARRSRADGAAKTADAREATNAAEKMLRDTISGKRTRSLLVQRI